MDSETFVKICGLADDVSIDAAVEAGADMIGFVFFEKSPRNVSLSIAERLAQYARQKSSEILVTALVVNPKDQALSELVSVLRPDFVQLHGAESPARVEAVQNTFNVRVIKAIGVETQQDVDDALVYDGVANRVLFDAKPPRDSELPGGNGLTFDWRILKNVSGRPGVMLSGGLTPENVAEAIQLTSVPAVDVSSGVERAPGHKDPVLIRRFIAAAKAAKKAA